MTIEIGQAVLERRADGSLLITTVGGTDPSFSPRQVDEFRDFLDETNEWLADRATPTTPAPGSGASQES